MKFNLKSLLKFGLALIILLNFSCVRFILEDDPDVSFERISGIVNSPVQFFVISDYGFIGEEQQKDVAKAMSDLGSKIRLDFILTCGDNFQNMGVSSVSDSLWYYNFENIYNLKGLNVPWYPALGNHDYFGNPEALIQYSSVNPMWKMPSNYYCFTKSLNSQNKILFVVIDTNNLLNEIAQMNEDSSLYSIEQFKWLDSVLINHKEKWVVVTGHHPVYSSGIVHGDTPELIKYLKPIFDKYKVDFYICGHDHQFEHIHLKDTYTDFVITGVGGSPRTTYKGINTIFIASVAGFTFVQAYNNFLSLYFVNSNGEKIYNYEKIKVSQLNKR